MAEKNLPAFNIKPENVLAKIHLEALKTVPSRYKLFNTGIVNMNSLLRGDFKKGKFDLENKSEIYEIGVMFNIDVKKPNRWQTQLKIEVANAVKAIHKYLITFSGYHKSKHITVDDVFCFVSTKPNLLPENVTDYNNYSFASLYPTDQLPSTGTVPAKNIYGIPQIISAPTEIKGFMVTCKYQIDTSNMI